MDKERTVRIHEEKERSLRFVDEAGTSHTYALLTSVRTIYVYASSLSVSEGFSSRTGFSEPPPMQLTPHRFVRGFGTLCDKGVAVIGDPDNQTSRIALSILTRTADEHAEAVKQPQPDGIDDSGTGVPSHCDAILGFTTADWEIGNQNESWLELSVAEKTLDSLADAVLNKRARSLHIGVGLRNIYTDAGPGELDFGETINLFLRPSIGEGNVRRPEVAYGHLKSWSLKLSGAVELLDPFERESPLTPQINVPEEPRGPSDYERALAALENLTANVGRLRSTFIRLAWALAAALVLSVLLR